MRRNPSSICDILMEVNPQLGFLRIGDQADAWKDKIQAALSPSTLWIREWTAICNQFLQSQWC